MRFEKPLHWSEGLFLQQQHFQYFQDFLQNRFRQNRELMMTYPWGFLNVNIDDEALTNLRVTIKTVTAIFPCGVEISMPGNTIIPPLDLKKLLEEVQEPVMVYLGLPLHNQNDGNQAADTAEKRMYLPEETSVHDDYTGKSEITMVTDRLNVRITTSLQDNADLDLLPLMRLIPLGHGATDMKVEVDTRFIPPYLLFGSCAIFVNRFQELTRLMDRRRNKILNELQIMGYTPDMFSGAVGQSIMMLSVLNEYINRFTSYLAHFTMSPYFVYLELCSLAEKLSAFQPLRNWEDLSMYNHKDCAPQFLELVLWIRAMLLAEGDNIFQRVDFVKNEQTHFTEAALSADQIKQADEYYLAIRCRGNVRDLVLAVEKGDNFRLTSKKRASRRIRGIKLIENRYPPRYFPALRDTLWFKIDNHDPADHIWQEICEDGTMILDWADSIFPELEASLFITMVEQGDSAK